MKCDNTKVPYQISRIIGTPIFKLAYHPHIINKEFIPKDGPILLCGNHLHVMDQFPVICATKRTTHWMAKKEYFDSKLGPFFKITGAISVDRGGNTENATNKVLEILNQNGAVGLFPEGTRNSLKENDYVGLFDTININDGYDSFKNEIKKSNPKKSQVDFLLKLYNTNKITKSELQQYLYSVDESLLNLKNANIITDAEYDDALLLPFKYGAVSFAAKTNAKIVPFAVNGSYKHNNSDLIVSFGEPMTANIDTLEEDNKKLRNKVLELTKNNVKKK